MYASIGGNNASHVRASISASMVHSGTNRGDAGASPEPLCARTILVNRCASTAMRNIMTCTLYTHMDVLRCLEVAINRSYRNISGGSIFLTNIDSC